MVCRLKGRSLKLEVLPARRSRPVSPSCGSAQSVRECESVIERESVRVLHSEREREPEGQRDREGEGERWRGREGEREGER